MAVPALSDKHPDHEPVSVRDGVVHLLRGFGMRQRAFVPATTDANHRWCVVPTDFKPGITVTVHSIVSPLFGLN